MTKDATLTLPTDLYRPTTDVATAYSALDKQGAEARFKRIDLIASIWAEELPNGQKGIVERVMKRFHLEAEDKKARTTIGDSIRIFKTFRLAGEQGLGYSRDKLVDVPFSRLRAVAQKHDWAIKHKDEIEHVLSLPEEGEDGINAYIRQREEAEGKEAKPKKAPAFVSRNLRMTPEDAAGFDGMIEVVRAAMLEQGRTLSEKPEIALGQIVRYIMIDWFVVERVGDEGSYNLMAYLPDGVMTDDEEGDAEEKEDRPQAA